MLCAFSIVRGLLTDMSYAYGGLTGERPAGVNIYLNVKLSVAFYPISILTSPVSVVISHLPPVTVCGTSILLVWLSTVNIL